MTSCADPSEPDYCYRSPEQILGTLKPFNAPQADFWALGVMLYELLHRRVPFHTKSEIVRSPLAIDEKRVPRELRIVLRRCLAQPPSDDRYDSIDGLIRDLKAAIRRHSTARLQWLIGTAAIAIFLVASLIVAWAVFLFSND
jgi:serine/threonine protein kinase